MVASRSIAAHPRSWEHPEKQRFCAACAALSLDFGARPQWYVALRPGAVSEANREEPEMRPMLNRIHQTALTAFFVLADLVPAAAAQRGQPSPWEINFQPAATPIMEFIETFHNWLLVI